MIVRSHLDPQAGAGGDGARLVGGLADVDSLVRGVEVVYVHPPVPHYLHAGRQPLLGLPSASPRPGDVGRRVPPSLECADMRSLGRNANGNHNTQSRHLPRCGARKLLLCAALRGLKWKRQSHCNGDRISQTAGSVLTQNLNDLLLHRKLIIVLQAGNICEDWIYISIVHYQEVRLL